MTELSFMKIGLIKATQYDGTQEMADKLGIVTNHEQFSQMNTSPIGDYIETLEGAMNVQKGNWIATGSDNEHWAIKDTIFKKTYTEYHELPENVLSYLHACISHEYTLGEALTSSSTSSLIIHDLSFDESDQIIQWLRNDKNQESFALTWIKETNK